MGWSIDGVWATDPTDVPAWKEKKWGTKMMIWGGFSAKGVTQLRFLENNDNDDNDWHYDNSFTTQWHLQSCHDANVSDPSDEKSTVVSTEEHQLR